MSLSLSDFFILASVLQGLFVGLAILCAPFFKSKTNNYLAGFILLLSAITFMGWQELDAFWPDYIWSLMWEFLLPVFLFQYFLRVLEHPYLKAKWLPWLYAPFVIILAFDLVFDFDFSFDVYKLPFEEEHPIYVFYDALLDSLSLWWNIFMIGWAFIIARSDERANPEKKRWLIRFGTVMMSVLVVWFLSDYVQARTGIEDPFSAVWLAISLMVWWVAYAGVYQLRILDEREEIHALMVGRSIKSEPVLITESKTTDNGYTVQLKCLMEEEHLYRNPDLGRQMVAEHLGISEGYVSQVMQENVGEGFVEFVNGHRIMAAKRMLSDPDFAPYSLEAIGREAGFKSRSSFYDSFKKATGQTPGTYRKRGENVLI